MNCLPGNGVSKSTHGAIARPSTGQPAVRHVAAVERAFAVLDALADGRRARHERDRAPHGDQREHGVAPARDARRGAVRRARRRDRPLPARRCGSSSSATPCSAGSTCASSRGRTCRRSSRETGETATLSAPGEHDAVTVDFVQSSSSVQSVAQLGRPSVGHATATGKVMLAFGDVELPPGPLAAYTPRTITTATRSPRSSSACAGAATPRPGGARGRPRGRRRAGVRTPRRARRRSSASRARRRGSTRGRCARRCRAARARRRRLAALGWRRRRASRSRGQPDEAGRPLADALRQLRVGPPPQALAVRPDDEQPGLALGDELEQRVDRARAAERAAARPRRRATAASSAGARSASSTSWVLDVLVRHRERDRRERHLGDVDDDQAAGPTRRRRRPRTRSPRASNGTSNVTSITGPAAARRPGCRRSCGCAGVAEHALLRGGAASAACSSRTCAATRDAGAAGRRAAQSAITSTNRMNANWTPTITASGIRIAASDERRAERRASR